MQFSVSSYEILQLLIKQVDNFFLITKKEIDILTFVFEDVLKRCEFCFSYQTNKYYFNNGETHFSPFHSGQYTIFLYYYSNEV